MGTVHIKEIINHSGGARGADAEWRIQGTRVGVRTIDYSFDGHSHYTTEASIRVLSNRELELANSFLLLANATLKRRVPPLYTYVGKLLRRNLYQVINASIILAIAPLEDSVIVRGGTGWAVQMARDLKKTVYVFDDGQMNKWYISSDGSTFALFDGIPNLSLNFAGIGSRNITDTGRKAIRNVYDNYDKLLQVNTL